MPVSNELERLEQLRADGFFTEKEFARAKANLLEAPPDAGTGMGIDEESGLGGLRSGFDANKYSMWLHLSQLLGLVLVPIGFIVPIILWRMKRDSSPMVDTNGKHVINGYISYTIYLTVSAVITYIVHHHAAHWVFRVAATATTILVIVVTLAFPVVGAVKASKGICWGHPLAIKFVQ